jgi:putative membrane protein
MSPAVHAILADWTLPPWLTGLSLLSAVIYHRGWIVIRKTRKTQFTVLRLASFFSGLAVLWIAIGSPMDGFADAMLSTHMVEHLLLMSVVPPLLLLGLPAVPLIRGLPSAPMLLMLAPLMRSQSIRRFGHRLLTPLVAWMSMNIAFLGWHIPSAYDFALEHEKWHAVEHLCFLVSSLLFWWCVIRPWPAPRRRSRWGILIFLVSADLVNTILSAFLAFCGRPVYSYYLARPNPMGLSALDDQILGAVIMWVFGSLAFLIPAVYIAFREMSSQAS